MSQSSLVIQDCNGHVDIAIMDHEDRTVIVTVLDLPGTLALAKALTDIANDPSKEWDKPSSTIVGGGHG